MNASVRLYDDRRAAGRLLAQHLLRYRGRAEVLVLALPRGGVPVGYEVAHALEAPLDVFLVRKLGAPGHPELAMAAIANGGILVLDQDVVGGLEVSRAVIDTIIDAEAHELGRRARLYREGRSPADIGGRIALLVDDGLATGSSMRAAIEAPRQHQPARVIVAVPVAPADACAGLRELADEVVCPFTPDPFYAVGLWYEDFRQTSDDEVRELLARAPAVRSSSPAAGSMR
jgi:predicted phosphoribosyltransferase